MDNSYTKKDKEWYPQKRLKDQFSCMKKEDGYMTLLACFLFLVISGLLLVCLDGSLLYQAKARCSMTQTGLSEHLLANYDVALAKRYHLYFLDPRMNRDELVKKSEEYYDEVLCGSTSAGFFSSPVWRLEKEYIETIPFGTMQEKDFEYFIAQIEDFMKYDLTKDIAMKVLGQTVQETEKQTDHIDKTVHDLDEHEPAADDQPDTADETLTPSEVAQGEAADEEMKENNPLQKLRTFLEYGVLGIIADESKLSEAKIAPSLLPFKNQNENKIHLSMDLLKNLGDIKALLTEQGLDRMGDHLTSQGTVNLYIQKYFNSYKKSPSIKDTKLSYEAEYILGGQYSDKENLEYVVNRLILLRFALNASYAFSNEELRSQALSMAAVLTGITGTPEFVEAVRYIILAAVNLIESIMDVDALLDGEKVPVLKTGADWRTSINGIAEKYVSSNEDGFSYQDYLLVLLVLQTDMESKCYRMQNLMQINIQQEEPAFQIKECRAGIKLKTGIRVEPMFYLKDYLLENEQKIEY